MVVIFVGFLFWCGLKMCNISPIGLGVCSSINPSYGFSCFLNPVPSFKMKLEKYYHKINTSVTHLHFHKCHTKYTISRQKNVLFFVGETWNRLNIAMVEIETGISSGKEIICYVMWQHSFGDRTSYHSIAKSE